MRVLGIYSRLLEIFCSFGLANVFKNFAYSKRNKFDSWNRGVRFNGWLWKRALFMKGDTRGKLLQKLCTRSFDFLIFHVIFCFRFFDFFLIFLKSVRDFFEWGWMELNSSSLYLFRTCCFFLYYLLDSPHARVHNLLRMTKCQKICFFLSLRIWLLCLFLSRNHRGASSLISIVLL